MLFLSQYSEISLFYVYFFSFYLTNFYFFKRKKAMNITAFHHAFFSTFFGFYSLFIKNNQFHPFLYNFTTGYFLFDASYLFYYKPFNLMTFAYFYHHLASIYLLNNTPNHRLTSSVVSFAELSNIPSYFVTHHLINNSIIIPGSHSNHNNTQKLFFWLRLQKWSYMLIRIPILGIFTAYALIQHFNHFPILFSTPVYFMGLYWSKILIARKPQSYITN